MKITAAVIWLILLALGCHFCSSLKHIIWHSDTIPIYNIDCIFIDFIGRETSFKLQMHIQNASLHFYCTFEREKKIFFFSSQDLQKFAQDLVDRKLICRNSFVWRALHFLHITFFFFFSFFANANIWGTFI